MNKNLWHADSYKNFPLAQGPDYPDADAVARVEARLRSFPTLVHETEVLRLREQLAAVSRGEAFLLQGGDCAESFADFRPEIIRDNFKVFLQMAIVLTFGAKKPVVKVGRVAGQFAKPRSSPFETRNGVTLPAYRGDILNGHEFDPALRQHDPERMERAYFQASATLNALRYYAKGGLADLRKVQTWNLESVRGMGQDGRFDAIVRGIADTISFLQAAGVAEGSALSTTEFFTSHEALLLPFEAALVRNGEEQARPFAGSAHMLWIGERTRQLDGAHVEFARGLANPIGLKCGPDTKPEMLLRLLDRLNPENQEGKVTLIPRLGASRIELVLPKILRRLKGEGRHVVTCCDPMHGNSITTPSGIKTRAFQDILEETKRFFAIHAAEGCHAGGVHLELTGQDVTECTGGGQGIQSENLDRYETLCDPRLNASQALELAFELVRETR